MTVLSLRDEGRLDIDAPLGERGPPGTCGRVRARRTRRPGHGAPAADDGRRTAAGRSLGGSPHGPRERVGDRSCSRAAQRARAHPARPSSTPTTAGPRSGASIATVTGRAPPGRRGASAFSSRWACARRSGAPAICRRSGSRRGTALRATGYTAEVPLADGGDFAALGGLYSSVRDLARWSGVFLDAEPPREAAERAPVSRATLREMQRARSAFAPGVEWPSLAEPPGVVAGGYGYGLMIWHERDGQRHVGHPGGLPGLRHADALGAGARPERDPARERHLRPVRAARCGARWQLVAREAALPRRAIRARSGTAGRARRGRRPVERWDDGAAGAAVRAQRRSGPPAGERRAELEALRERHGALVRDGELEPEDALRGRWRLRGERGHVELAITLAPTVPPLVQTLGVESVLPPAGPLGDAGATAAARRERAAPRERSATLLAPGGRRGRGTARAARSPRRSTARSETPSRSRATARRRRRCACRASAVRVDLELELETGRSAPGAPRRCAPRRRRSRAHARRASTAHGTDVRA